jgi:fermentation-respiration switch protein FrsA (DUF1100 family)
MSVARFLIAAIIGGLVLKGVIGALESRFVFFPSRGEDVNPASLGIAYRVVPLTASDGVRLTAWQLEPERPVADVVYFHGNGGNLSVWLPVLAALHRLNLRVLAVDYRGYGLSAGSPSERGVYLDAEAAARHARSQRPGRPLLPLVFWGRSLGGPIAASATRAVTPDALVLEGSFADKAAVAGTQPVLKVLNLFASYRFPTVELMRDFRNPVLVMHGARDSIVPLALGRDLFDRLSSPKQFVVIPGADHNDFFDVSQTAYWTPVLEFITRIRGR